MTALSRVRSALSAGERPADADVREVCADAGRLEFLIATAEGYGMHMGAVLYAPQLVIPRGMTSANALAAIDAAIREPK